MRVKDDSDIPESYRKVFLGGLSLRLDTDDVKEYFEKYGELVDCIVMRDPTTKKSRGFGFVTFKDPAIVDEIQKTRPHEIDGKTIECKRAIPKEEGNNAEVHANVCKLYVGNLRKDVTEDDLREYFQSYGKIEEVLVMKDRETNESRGFGFVTFDDYDPVDKAIIYKPHSIKSSNADAKKARPRESSQKPSGNPRMTAMSPMGSGSFGMGSRGNGNFGSGYLQERYGGSYGGGFGGSGYGSGSYGSRSSFNGQMRNNYDSFGMRNQAGGFGSYSEYTGMGAGGPMRTMQSNRFQPYGGGGMRGGRPGGR